MRLHEMLTIMIISLTNSFTALAAPSECRSLFNGSSADSYKGQLYLDSNVLKNESLDFIEHIGPSDNPMGSAMAMNIQYSPILALRHQIEKKLNLKKPLNFLKAWSPNGEAHVTTITPVDYRKLKGFVDIGKINQIARDFDIQASDLTILGIGRGKAVIEEKNEETYFVIVKSENLLKIRRAIYQEFLKAKGDPNAWDPEHFFPHITIGYTRGDLHEDNGVIKDVKNSLDIRFQLVLN